VARYGFDRVTNSPNRLPPMIDQVLIYVLATMFFATAIRATFGFGEALLAMPLLAIFVGLDVARPLVAMTSVTMAVSILLKDGQRVRVSSTWRLVLSSAVGIPVGFFLVSRINETPVKIVLAILILAFAGYRLTRPRMIRLESDQLSFVFGFISGILGGAYNTAGPPIVVYASMREWSPADFRATMQGVFLPTSILIVVGHGLDGLLTPNVLFYFAATLPVLAISLLLGRQLNARFGHSRFAWTVNWLLIAIGSWPLFDSLMT
jgi:uncharacterized membrane protein YfcA